MKKTNHDLGKIIREAREKKGYTQTELAALLGYNNPQFVSLFERGLSKVPLFVLGKLVKELNISEKKIAELLLAEYEEKLMNEIRRGVSS